MTEPRENRPAVTVIIPFLNREKFLSESIESVLAQTFTHWELILVDDGSTDDSLAVANAFVDKFPGQIFLYTHENGKHRGASSSRNLGINHAKGEFITFLDSDDIFLPDTLEIELDVFKKNPGAEVVCGTLEYWFSWTDERDIKERDFVVKLGLESDKLYQPPSLLVHNLRACGRKPGIGSVILRSGCAEKIDLFEDDFVYVSEDQLFWAKVSLNFQIYIIDACLLKYRQHGKSSVAELIESRQLVPDWNELLTWVENYLAEKKIEDQEIWEALRACQKENYYRGKFERILNIYQKILPVRTRYRIRDFIIRWRTRGKG